MDYPSLDLSKFGTTTKPAFGAFAPVSDQPAVGASEPPMQLAQADVMSSADRNAYFNATGERISGGGNTNVAPTAQPIVEAARPPGYISATPPSNLSGLVQMKMKSGMTEAAARQWASERGIK